VAGVRVRPDQKAFTIVSNGAGSFNRPATFAALVLSAIVIGGCESLGIVDTKSLLVPTFQRSEVFGFVAGLGTTFAAMPDLIRMLKRRSSKGMNPTMAGIMGVFQILWIYYGLLILSRPVIVWNTIAVVINLLTVGAYLRFARNET
jgi:MtN3 and saliva related transmembrane protein